VSRLLIDFCGFLSLCSEHFTVGTGWAKNLLVSQHLLTLLLR
jgi:hypothetical protein